MFPLPVLGVSASALALLVLLCASAAGSDPDLFSGYVPDDEVQRLQQAHTMHNGVRGIPWKGDGLPWDIVDTPSSYLEESEMHPRGLPPDKGSQFAVDNEAAYFSGGVVAVPIYQQPGAGDAPEDGSSKMGSELMVRVEMGMFKTKFEFALDINSATTWVATMLCFTPGCLEQTRYIPLPTFYGLPITNKFNLAAFLIAPNPMLPLPIFHYGGAHYQAAMMGMYVWDEIYFSEDYLVPPNGKLPCGTKCDGSGEEYNTQLPSSEGEDGSTPPSMVGAEYGKPLEAPPPSKVVAGPKGAALAGMQAKMGKLRRLLSTETSPVSLEKGEDCAGGCTQQSSGSSGPVKTPPAGAPSRMPFTFTSTNPAAPLKTGKSAVPEKRAAAKSSLPVEEHYESLSPKSFPKGNPLALKNPSTLGMPTAADENRGDRAKQAKKHTLHVQLSTASANHEAAKAQALAVILANEAKASAEKASKATSAAEIAEAKAQSATSTAASDGTTTAKVTAKKADSVAKQARKKANAILEEAKEDLELSEAAKKEQIARIADAFAANATLEAASQDATAAEAEDKGKGLRMPKPTHPPNLKLAFQLHDCVFVKQAKCDNILGKDHAKCLALKELGPKGRGVRAVVTGNEDQGEMFSLLFRDNVRIDFPMSIVENAPFKFNEQIIMRSGKYKGQLGYLDADHNASDCLQARHAIRLKSGKRILNKKTSSFVEDVISGETKPPLIGRPCGPDPVTKLVGKCIDSTTTPCKGKPIDPVYCGLEEVDENPDINCCVIPPGAKISLFDDVELKGKMIDIPVGKYDLPDLTKMSADSGMDIKWCTQGAIKSIENTKGLLFRAYPEPGFKGAHYQGFAVKQDDLTLNDGKPTNFKKICSLQVIDQKNTAKGAPMLHNDKDSTKPLPLNDPVFEPYKLGQEDVDRLKNESVAARKEKDALIDKITADKAAKKLYAEVKQKEDEDREGQATENAELTSAETNAAEKADASTKQSAAQKRAEHEEFEANRTFSLLQVDSPAEEMPTLTDLSKKTKLKKVAWYDPLARKLFREGLAKEMGGKMKVAVGEIPILDVLLDSKGFKDPSAPTGGNEAASYSGILGLGSQWNLAHFKFLPPANMGIPWKFGPHPLVEDLFGYSKHCGNFAPSKAKKGSRSLDDEDCMGADTISCAELPSSCSEIYKKEWDKATWEADLKEKQPHKQLKSGMYKTKSGEVFCDMQSDGGGWTLVADAAAGMFVNAKGKGIPDSKELIQESSEVAISWGGPPVGEGKVMMDMGTVLKWDIFQKNCFDGKKSPLGMILGPIMCMFKPIPIPMIPTLVAPVIFMEMFDFFVKATCLSGACGWATLPSILGPITGTHSFGSCGGIAYGIGNMLHIGVHLFDAPCLGLFNSCGLLNIMNLPPIAAVWVRSHPVMAYKPGKILSNRFSKPLYSIWLDPETGKNGVLYFGGVDPARIAECDECSPLKCFDWLDTKALKNPMLPLLPSWVSWAFKIDKIKMNDEEIPGCNGCDAYIDTMNPGIEGKADMVAEMMSNGMALSDGCDSDLSLLPKITFVINGKDYVMEGPDYTVVNNDPATGQPSHCTIGIGSKVKYGSKTIIELSIDKLPDALAESWTFGQAFLRSFYTVFDVQNDRFGFTKAAKGARKRQNRPPPPPKCGTNKAGYQELRKEWLKTLPPVQPKSGSGSGDSVMRFQRETTGSGSEPTSTCEQWGCKPECAGMLGKLGDILPFYKAAGWDTHPKAHQIICDDVAKQDPSRVAKAESEVKTQSASAEGGVAGGGGDGSASEGSENFPEEAKASSAMVSKLDLCETASKLGADLAKTKQEPPVCVSRVLTWMGKHNSTRLNGTTCRCRAVMDTATQCAIYSGKAMNRDQKFALEPLEAVLLASANALKLQSALKTATCDICAPDIIPAAMAMWACSNNLPQEAVAEAAATMFDKAVKQQVMCGGDDLAYGRARAAALAVATCATFKGEKNATHIGEAALKAAKENNATTSQALGIAIDAANVAQDALYAQAEIPKLAPLPNATHSSVDQDKIVAASMLADDLKNNPDNDDVWGEEQEKVDPKVSNSKQRKGAQMFSDTLRSASIDDSSGQGTRGSTATKRGSMNPAESQLLPVSAGAFSIEPLPTAHHETREFPKAPVTPKEASLPGSLSHGSPPHVSVAGARSVAAAVRRQYAETEERVRVSKSASITGAAAQTVLADDGADAGLRSAMHTAQKFKKLPG